MVRNYFKFSAFPLILFCAFLFLAAAVLPASAQIFTALEPELTSTPAPEGISAVKETPVPAEIYMQKMFVPTNTPKPEGAVVVIPDPEYTMICETSPLPHCDLNDQSIIDNNPDDTIIKLYLNLKNAPSYTGTFGNIYRNTCDDPTACHLIDFYSTKPSIDLATVYDTSAGTTGINVTNEQSTLKAVALNSSTGQKVDTYLLNTSVDLFNQKNAAEITAKAINVEQTGSEAAINVFGNASVKIYPDNILGNIKANTLTANPVELTAKGGEINMNVGAVKTDVLNANEITAEGVKLTAENNTENNTQGLVTFTSGRQWYYHVNKWIREGEEKLVVDPKYLDKNNSLTFDVTSNVIENIQSYDKTLLTENEHFNIYFLENKSTGEILYANKESENIYYEAIMKAGTYKQCEPVYPGNITVITEGSNISAYGAHLTTKAGDNTIHFETTNGGQISVTADGSVKNAYGLYTDSDGGTITALIEGSITESSNTETALGNTAGILMTGKSGEVNIQVGVVPDEPPVGEKEIKVSGSQVGIYNISTNGQTKNVVIFGTVTGGTAPILTDSTGGSSFTLAAWAIAQKDGHIAFTKTMEADTAFENNIRYILLADPSVWDEVKIESAGTDEALAIKENENVGAISQYCESGFTGGYHKNLREEKRNFYIQNLKENKETYYWANAGKTVTLKSSKEGYHLTEAYWRDGMNETDKMACSDGVCTFTVPMGGGVWIHDVKTAKDTEVTITDKDGQEVKTVYYGDTLELKASADPEAQGTWTWSVSDPSTAEVTQDGNVSILSVSASPITITAEYTSAAATGKGSVELTVLPRPVTIKADAKTKVYDNDPATDPNLTATVKNAVPGDTINYSLSREPGQDVGNYSIIVTADAESNPNYEITAVNSTFSITEKSEPSNNRIDFFRIFEETQLPATGFSSLFANTLSEQPMALNYEPTHLRLQIPVIDLTTELVTVPLMNDTWQVEWLGNRAGVLEGSSMPGEGYSFIAAHNTLNSEEYGPFALLSTMEPNDLITVNSEDGAMKLFRIYANELINANDVQKLEKTAEQEAGSLVLITCENESVDGGYLDRRVIFAKPL